MLLQYIHLQKLSHHIVLHLFHSLHRTKALVLELLAAVCLVRGGHEIILSAFDNFKEVSYSVSSEGGICLYSLDG